MNPLGWLLILTLLVASPASAPVPQEPAPIRIVLVGDSTVTDDSGWGLGFKQLLTDRVVCINTAANGRSSKSFIDEGRWQAALAQRGDYYLIQFGHNDQPGKGADRENRSGHDISRQHRALRGRGPRGGRDSRAGHVARAAHVRPLGPHAHIDADALGQRRQERGRSSASGRDRSRGQQRGLERAAGAGRLVRVQPEDGHRRMGYDASEREGQPGVRAARGRRAATESAGARCGIPYRTCPARRFAFRRRTPRCLRRQQADSLGPGPGSAGGVVRDAGGRTHRPQCGAVPADHGRLAQEPRHGRDALAAEAAKVRSERPETDSTIDNSATTGQVRDLAKVYAAVRDPSLRAPMLAGVDDLLAAQYPSGGWPRYIRSAPTTPGASRSMTMRWCA